MLTLALGCGTSQIATPDVELEPPSGVSGDFSLTSDSHQFESASAWNTMSFRQKDGQVRIPQELDYSSSTIILIACCYMRPCNRCLITGRYIRWLDVN
jgi:hypothetical protein